MKTVELFDTHAHYDDSRFEEDSDEVIKNAYDSGVKYILNAGSDIKTSERSIEIAEKFPYLYAAVGIHPHEVGKLEKNAEEKLIEMSAHPKVAAIGEIGLDYYYDHSPRDTQKYWLSKQLDIASKLKLPVIIHNRDSHEDMMKIIKNHAPYEASGVFHCFSGSWEMAKELLDMGLYLSFGGPITFKNAKKALEVLEKTPLESILIETDCPYLTPEPYRGRRNDSSYVRLVAEKIAEIRGLSLEETAGITTGNAKRLFGIDNHNRE